MSEVMWGTSRIGFIFDKLKEDVRVKIGRVEGKRNKLLTVLTRKVWILRMTKTHIISSFNKTTIRLQ